MAAPGMATGSPEHVALLSLYDPTHLRVRVDVEQSEVAKLAVGGAAAVRAPTRPGEDYHGTITRIVRQANVEKVTLQVHVRVDDPDEALRPEMVVETRFTLAATGGADAAGGGAPAGGGASDAFWIPARLLDARDGAAVVWIVNGADGRAALRRVTVARRDGDRALVTAGLNLTDKLVDGPRDQLREGARLEIAAEGR
jgi:multidrug efflux pump subunit AcrA (membrane-fusion protein)